MLNKIVSSLEAAVAGIRDGASIMIGGFGTAGMPFALIDAVLDLGARDLTIISNNAGNGRSGVAKLLEAGRVGKIVCTYPRSNDCFVMEELYRNRKIQLELVPQGTFIERIRAGGAGIGGFFSPTGVGTPLAAGKEIRNIHGMDYLFEHSLRSDVALLKAHSGDRWGNVVYKKTARNFAPLMATAAHLTVIQVAEVVDLGELDPERVGTPGIFVDRIVQTEGKL